MSSRRSKLLMRWSLAMRICAWVMAFQLFMLPQMLTAQRILDVYEESGSKQAPVLEEEVLKHACEIRSTLTVLDLPNNAVVLIHRCEEGMLEHPLIEVPHQPPK